MCELALNFTTKLATTQLWHTRDSSPISLPLMFETKSEETWGGNFKTEHAHVLQRYVYDLFVRGNATRRASALCCRFRLLATSSRRTQHISGVCVLFFFVCVWKLDRRRKTERTGSRTKFPSTCPPYTMMRLCRRRRWRQRRRCRRLLYATAPACTPSTASMFGVRNHVENMSCGHAPVPPIPALIQVFRGTTQRLGLLTTCRKLCRACRIKHTLTHTRTHSGTLPPQSIMSIPCVCVHAASHRNAQQIPHARARPHTYGKQ